MKNSIRTDIFYSSVAFSSLMLLIFAIFFTHTLYQSGMDTARDVIKQRNYAVNFFIDGFFAKTNNTLEFLSVDKRVQDASRLPIEEQQKLLSLYKMLSTTSKSVSYVYSAYENGLMLLPDYTPPAGYDPRKRPWYRTIKAHQPYLSTGLPYLNIEAKQWFFSSGKALISDGNGFTGVVAVDSPIDTIVMQLEHLGERYESSHSFVMDPTGKVLLHHDEELLNKNINDILDVPVTFDENEGVIERRVNGTDKIAYFSRCEEVDWIVVTVVDKEEITSVILYKIIFYLLLTGAIAIIFGVAQSSLLSKRFLEPLIQLHCKILHIIDNKRESKCCFKFPDNEIGELASEISSLTNKEFYAKSKALEKTNALLEKANLELQTLSITDPLSKLYNRHKIDIELLHEHSLGKRYGGTFSMLLIDIDFFKRVNDNYGHPAGDSVIKQLGALLSRNCRDVDVVGRWGGEEFIILCPKINVRQAIELANRVRTDVEKYNFTISAPITVSIGVAEFRSHECVSELIKRCDDNLYQAKNNGRNCVVS